MAREKSEMVMVRMSKMEKEKILNLSKQYGLTLSDYIRFVSLNTRIVVTTTKNQ